MESSCLLCSGISPGDGGMAGAARHVGDPERNVAVPLVVGDGEAVLRQGDGGRLGDGIERRKRQG